MAQFQYQIFEGVILPVSLMLYGYLKPDNTEQRTPKADTAVTLRGVIVSNLSEVNSNPDTPWKLGLSAGRQYADIHCQTTVESAVSDKVATTCVTERRYWGREKVQLVTTETRETNIAVGVVKITLCSRASDVPADDVELSSERRSLHHGLLQWRLHKSEQVRWQYDKLGRVLRETSYANNPVHNDKVTRTDKALTDIDTHYEEINGGVRITSIDRAHVNARYQRVFQDGLQQVVSVEQQRQPGADVSDGNFCPVRAQGITLDYLPGGLQRQVDLSVQPDNARDWFWAGSNDRDSTLSVDGVPQFTKEETLGDSRGARLIHEHSQQNLKNGSTLHIDSAHLPLSANSPLPLPRFSTEKTFDPLGRMTQLKQSAKDVPNSERVFKVDYDELDRPVAWTSPEGTKVKRTYGGLGDIVTRLSITGGGTGDREIVIGQQTLKGQARVDKRLVGARNYNFVYTNGVFSAIEMPDTTRLFSEVSDDGNTLSWKTETTSSTGKATTTLATFTYDPLQTALLATRPAVPTAQQSEVNASARESDWLSSLNRRVTSDLVLNTGFYRSLLGTAYVTQYASDSQVVAWRDGLNRRTRVQRDRLEYHYLYDAWGQCERTTVRDLQTGHTLAVVHEFDGFGQETCRRYDLNHEEVETYQQQWSASGQLIGKVLSRKGVTCLSERFNYDLRERLQEWVVDDATVDGPQDAGGKSIRNQTYEYDLLNNLIACATTFVDRSKQRQEYSYNASNPTQRIKTVTINTPAPDSAGRTANPVRTEAILAYDLNGNLTQDELGRRLSYSMTGRLAAVTGRDNRLITRYEYDEQDRLTIQWDEQAQQRRVLIYSDDALCGEVWLDQTGKELKRLRFDEEAGLAVQLITDQSQQTVFTLSDPQSGMTSEYRPDQTAALVHNSVSYTPWGECADTRRSSLISGVGYNEARRDPLTGCYHLGEGYRVYNPSMRVFQQPDSASPFGYGGLNDYAYCSGDPVNLYDPNGHVMISRWGQDQMIQKLDQLISDFTPAKPPKTQQQDTTGSLVSSILWAGVAVLISVAAVLLAIPTGGASLVAAGTLLAATVVSSGLSIASVALQNSNPELSEKLSWAGFGLDMSTMVLPVKAAIAGGARMMRWGASKTGRLAGDIGKRLQRAGRRTTNIGTHLQGGATVELGGPMKNMRPLDADSPLSKHIYIFEDVYNVKKGNPLTRLNIAGHGVQLEDGSVEIYVNTVSKKFKILGKEIKVGDDFVTWKADRLYKELEQSGVQFSNYDVVRLCMCHSAEGAEKSFASRFSIEASLPVKGFHEPLTANFEPESTVSLFDQVLNKGFTIKEYSDRLFKKGDVFMSHKSQFIDSSGNLVTPIYRPEWFPSKPLK
ncbi:MULTISPECIES: RHS repeat-associated core domain-containing protein [unclassified Pseudomonas]|nr:MULTISPECIES: RHS repeat-associated core domain-containing protein [unclassified Pseudomonas]MEB0166143.1 RHS repeat-associated core domain-containing protein [Pseudomonas sp. CCC4.4]MEB0076380.1 RHS repeat-associated core domain-containing protein [Pseudomonas sp. MH10out]MEB0092727.1 RHS repeat-associated core domain-containing protein [Pseudomonas sp. CCI4.2]MEB0128840.1 RHS repeat-associated core domain-containing protein [Pseudomonas sp. CCI2.4]MEB0160609.1 RHS repeat-associated core d